MIVVDASKRASLEEVSHHEWLQQCLPDNLPEPDLPDMSFPELPESEIELILLRMEEGGYGRPPDVLRCQQH